MLYNSQPVSTPVWHISLLCVQWKTPDDGQRNCPKHVEFYSKNKFEKLEHLVGFIIRIYHYARSPERQNLALIFINVILQMHTEELTDFKRCFLIFFSNLSKIETPTTFKGPPYYEVYT